LAGVLFVDCQAGFTQRRGQIARLGFFADDQHTRRADDLAECRELIVLIIAITAFRLDHDCEIAEA
jgi:hypothetical protein